MKLIQHEVEMLIKKHGTNCPFKLAKALGIQVVFEPLGKILGFYNKHYRVPMIHINENINEKQQKFVCAHELGHAIKHADVNTPYLKRYTLFSTSKIELEANTFAVELLFSAEAIEHVTIQEAIEEYKIPKQLVMLKSLGK